MQPKAIRYIILGILILVAFVVLSNSTFITINPGERGVLFKKFGNGLDKEMVYEQGLQFVLPWNKMIIYDVREKIQEETLDVILGEGLDIKMDVAVRFKPIPSEIGNLHDELGENYADIVVKNAVRSAVREVASKFSPEEVYSTKKDAVRQQIEEQIAPILQERYLDLVRVDIRNIELPKTYTDAIQAKLVQEEKVLREKQEAERILIEAQAEADRKRIEANAIREFQEIINQGISDKYLKLKGIEATLELAKSPNSKVIIVGSGEEGLPLILGDGK